LLCAITFHQSPREKWKEVAQLLALSDGFRGKVTSVTASDPYATKEPFSVEYEITQLTLSIGLRNRCVFRRCCRRLGCLFRPAKTASGTATSAIDLGTPLDVETHLTLHLPAGTIARTPTGTFG